MTHIKRIDEDFRNIKYKRSPNLPKGSKTLDKINQIAYRISCLGGTHVWWDGEFRLLWAADSHESVDYCIYEIRTEYVVLKHTKEQYPNIEMRLDWLSENILSMILQSYIEECKNQLTSEAFDKVMQGLN